MTIVLLLFVVAPLAGLIIAPQIYNWLQSQASSSELVTAVAGYPFHRVASRCMMLFVIATLYPAYKLSGMRGLTDVGLDDFKAKKKLFFSGMGVSVAGVLVVYALGSLLGVYELRASDMALSGHLIEVLSISLGALFIGVFEEILFRGFVYNLLRSAMGFLPGILAGAFLYTIVHFVHPEFNGSSVTCLSGIELIPHILEQMESAYFVPFFLTLFGTGVVLSLVFEYTGSLYMAMGLHSGWVWIMMLWDHFMQNPNQNWLFGSKEVVSKSWMGVVFVLILIVLTELFRSRLRACRNTEEGLDNSHAK